MILFGIFIPETKGCALIDHMPDKKEKIGFKRTQQIVLAPTSAKLMEDV
jgi:hypothetical protein